MYFFGAEDILYELAAVYSLAAPAAEDAEDLTYFEQKTAAYITAPGCPHANGGMSGLSGCGGSVGLNTNIMVIMEVARMLRSKVHIFQFASIILYTGTTRSR